MIFSESMLLSLIVFLPLLAACFLFTPPFFTKDNDKESFAARFFSISVSILVFLLVTIKVLPRFDFNNPELQFVENFSWIKGFGINYFVAVDSISIFLVLLVSLIVPLIMIGSFAVKSRTKIYFASLLVLESAMLGTLMAQDLFLFFVFWELMLAPMYFIIGIWGSRRKIYASLKFLIYTAVGSLLMLVAIIYLAWHHQVQHGFMTFSVNHLIAGIDLTAKEEFWLFAAFFLAFGIKVPVFPFHTWLPDAQAEAPTGGAVALAGLMFNMGLYGVIRFAYPLFPNAVSAFSPALAALAVTGIVFCGLVAWVQEDVKKLIAYSTVSHLGFCLLGLAALGSVSSSGALLHMINHGISAAAVFFLIGFLYERKGVRMISDFGGLASKMPVFAALFLIVTFSIISLPLTNGFVSEFMILSDSFRVFPWLVSISLIGVVMGAVYMLTLYMRMMYGEPNNEKDSNIKDLSRSELCAILPLVLLIFVLGIYPNLIIKRIEPGINSYISKLVARTSTEKANQIRKNFNIEEKILLSNGA